MTNSNIDKPWPEGSLDKVTRCPVCEGAGRSLLHEGLTDRIFYCAPGMWTLWKCSSCGSAYLDPRPNEESIGLAYSNYFTHENRLKQAKELSLWNRIRRTLGNGYRNNKFGSNLSPASKLGMLLGIFPSQRLLKEQEFRNLEKSSFRQRLLDVGCGNGDFLYFAKSTGREVVGIDPDPEAVSVANSRGLDVRHGNIDILDPEVEKFDVITLGHVIEHVHNPADFLGKCFNMLKKGGYIWIETPNIESEGHFIYGRNWRGLEPPRHLVIFSYGSLVRTLESAGFSSVQDMPYRSLCRDIFALSEAISKKENNGLFLKTKRISEECKKNIKTSEKKALKDKSVREFITLKAFKGR